MIYTCARHIAINIQYLFRYQMLKFSTITLILIVEFFLVRVCLDEVVRLWRNTQKGFGCAFGQYSLFDDDCFVYLEPLRSFTRLIHNLIVNCAPRFSPDVSYPEKFCEMHCSSTDGAC